MARDTTPLPPPRTDSQEFASEVVEVLWRETTPRGGVAEPVERVGHQRPLHRIRDNKRLAVLSGERERERVRVCHCYMYVHVLCTVE